MLNVIRSLAAKHDLTIVLVTHEMRFAREIADRICFFDKGRIVEQGTPEAVLSRPENERTRAFLSSILCKSDPSPPLPSSSTTEALMS